MVVSTNTKAMTLWEDFDVEIIGNIPEGFLHGTLGYIDAYIIYKQ